MRHPLQRLYYGWFVLAAVCGINFANNATAIGALTVCIIPFSDDTDPHAVLPCRLGGGWGEAEPTSVPGGLILP